MKSLQLKRIVYLRNCTFGIIIDEESNSPFGVTLELPWKFNQINISCIPEGHYLCLPRKKSDTELVFRLYDVPNRSLIDIHIGNTNLDIEGCILVGQRFGKVLDLPAILDSRLALDSLRELVNDKSFILNITNA